jgi:predicted PurR-regulated permease PerM
MPNAFTLGAIAGVLYSVPYLGALLTIVLVSGVAFLAGGLKYMILVVGLNVLLHQILFDQIITPRILGSHVGLHPILSIVALLAGNVLLGILGMVLAVPVAASIQVVVLTLVPKLRHEVALSADAHAAPDTTASLSEETKEQQASTDATEELHRSVGQAVDNIEEQVRRIGQNESGSTGRAA